MTGELAKSLVAAQAEFPAIGKNSTAKVNMKAGGSYTFDYADLPSVLAAVKPILQANGLVMIHAVETENSKPCLHSRLMHTSGECIEARVNIPFSGDRIQELGSAITYMRRYQTLAMLDICAGDDDDDGNKADGNKAEIARTRQRAPKKESQDEPPMDTSDIPHGADIITAVVATKTKEGGKQYWRITTARGIKATTFDPHLAQIAGEYHINAAPCIIRAEPGKGGWMNLRDVTMFRKTQEQGEQQMAEPTKPDTSVKVDTVLVSRVVPELIGGVEVFHGMIDGWNIPLSTTDSDMAQELRDASEGGYECKVSWVATTKGGRRLCKIKRVKE